MNWKEKKIIRNIGGSGSLSKVQSTPRVLTTAQLTAAVTFAAPPVVGHGIIVVIDTFVAAGAITSVVDNQGNTYTLAVTKAETNLPNNLHIYFCSSITTTGNPFTITSTGSSSSRFMLAIEMGKSIAVDQVLSSNGAGASASIGPTPALSGSNVFSVAEIGTSSTTIAVDSTTPTWFQETEVLTGSPGGEIDSRLVPNASGTTQSASWTLNGANFWVAVLAVFK